MSPSANIDFKRLEALLSRDPARRGIAGFCHENERLASGQLEAAAGSLAKRLGSVAVVTGFCVVGPQQITAETDGPPGALYLARALAALGTEVILVSDRYGVPLLRTGCDLWQLDTVEVREFPFDTPPPQAPGPKRPVADRGNPSDAWVDALLNGPLGSRLSHVIAVERAGPSHTLESLAAQNRSGPVPGDDFQREVPPEYRDICFNMRGESIEAHTARTHRLFERIAEKRLPITTIGLADGGNEIGMGRFPWEVLREAIGLGTNARIACRIATDYTVLAGVSDWAAYALACSVAVLRGHRDLIDGWDAQGQRQLIEALVSRAGAVDGATRLRQPTVDGLPLETYLQTLSGIVEILASEASHGPGRS